MFYALLICKIPPSPLSIGDHDREGIVGRGVEGGHLGGVEKPKALMNAFLPPIHGHPPHHHDFGELDTHISGCSRIFFKILFPHASVSALLPGPLFLYLL